MIKLPIVLLLTLTGCSSSMAERGGDRAPGAREGCPLGVPGATVDVEETPEGVALVFTSPQHEGELRERARDAAAMHGPGAHVGAGHDGTHGSGGQHGLQAMQLPPARAVVVEVAGGARIDLVPADAEDRGALVTKAREGARRMRDAACR